MIMLDTGTTGRAEEFVERNIAMLGAIKSISHRRDMVKVDYETTIVGEKDTLIIKGGLTSGYSGTGPHGFIRVLKSLGLSEEAATRLVKGNTEEIHEFTHQF